MERLADTKRGSTREHIRDKDDEDEEEDDDGEMEGKNEEEIDVPSARSR